VKNTNPDLLARELEERADKGRLPKAVVFGASLAIKLT